jgi:hypothetical protein
VEERNNKKILDRLHFSLLRRARFHAHSPVANVVGGLEVSVTEKADA